MEVIISGVAFSALTSTHQKLRRQHGVNELGLGFFWDFERLISCLKLPILYHDKKCIDNMFFTCCILHNMLLSFDGLANRWENNVNWAGKDGEHSGEDIAIFRNHNR